MSARSLLAGALAAGAVMLAAAPAGALSQQYPPEAPLLSVSPSTVVVGESVTLTGTGYGPDEEVLITASTTPIAAPQAGRDDSTQEEFALVPVAQHTATELRVTADGQGGFTTTMTLHTVGQATITATGQQTGLSASVVVTVLASADGLPLTGGDVWRLVRIGGAGIIVGGLLLAAALFWRVRRAPTKV